MSLRYCEKCRIIYDDSISIRKHGRFFCKDCDVPLLYFGAEEVRLSSDNVFAAYDRLNPFSPLKDYTGKQFTDAYRNETDPVAFLECEDVLKHQPKNKEALLYLADYYRMCAKFSESRVYYERYLKETLLDEKKAGHYCDVLIHLKAFKHVEYFFKKSGSAYSDFFVSHYKAMTCLAAKQYKKALSFFYEAHSLCDSNERQSKIKAIIQQISSFLEQDESS